MRAHTRAFLLAALYFVLLGGALGALSSLASGFDEIARNRYDALGFSNTSYSILVRAADRGTASGAWMGLLWLPGIAAAYLVWRRITRGGASTLLLSILSEPVRTAQAQLACAAAWGAVLVVGTVLGQPSRRELCFVVLLGFATVIGLALFARRHRARLHRSEDPPLATTTACLSGLLLATASAYWVRAGLIDRVEWDVTLRSIATVAAVTVIGSLWILRWVRVAQEGGRVPLEAKAIALVALLPILAPIAVRATRPLFGPSTVSVDRPLNVLLIAVDTLRADHTTIVDEASYARDLTPNLRRLGRRGVVFDTAVSQSSWTLPAFASILTGRYPMQHGAISIAGALRDSEVTLAEIAREAGYDTGGVVSHLYLDREHGFGQGIDDFRDDLEQRPFDHELARRVTDVALEFLARDRKAPFALLVHYFDPHHPYLDHAESDYADSYDGWLVEQLPSMDLTRNMHLFGEADIQYLRDLYDEEVQTTDREICRLLDAVEREGLLENTLIVMVTDHGEQFMERGFLGHVRTLHDELVRVPLVVYHPDLERAGHVQGTPVETRRVFTTVLEALGIDFHSEQRPDVLPLDPFPAPMEPVFSQVWLPDSVNWLQFQLSSVRLGDWKLIHDHRRDTRRLYDLRSDPGELLDLAAEKRGKLDELGGLLDAWLGEMFSGQGSTTIKELDADMIDRLKETGYM